MSGTLVNYSFLGFIVASLTYAVYNFIKSEKVKKGFGYAGSALMLIGMVMMTAAILLRWRDAGRPPFSNMYESLILFAWSISLIYLVLELVYKIRVAGVIAAILTVVAIAAASFFNPTIEPLVPALQSNWLAYHVLTCFVGYAAFAVSAGASVLYLFLKARGKASKTEGEESTSGEIIKAMQSFNYEAVRFGFLFLGVGIITGAVWANEAERGLGHLLELGSEGDLVAHHLDHLRYLDTLQVCQRPLRHQGPQHLQRRLLDRRLSGGHLHLLRRQLHLERPAFIRIDASGAMQAGRECLRCLTKGFSPPADI